MATLVSTALNTASVQSNSCGHIRWFTTVKNICKGVMCAPLCQDLLRDTSILATSLLQLLSLSIPMCFLISTTKCKWGISHNQKGTKVWELLLWSRSWCASCMDEIKTF